MTGRAKSKLFAHTRAGIDDKAMNERAYFDWNATAPLRREAREAMVSALELAGNASSVHREGRAARALVEKAREQVAALVGAKPANVTFTSGGSEANMLALTPHLEVAGQKTPRDTLFVSAIEHPSVRSGGRFSAAEELPVTADGIIDLDVAEQRLARAEHPLVSVMLANNETGVVQPIGELAKIVHAANGILHVDAVQAVGRIAVDDDALGADMITISAHKIGGPQGAGALVRRGEIHIAQPLITGGRQERGMRAGTENVAAIAGFGAACAAVQASLDAETTRISGLRDTLEARLKASAPGVVIFGENAPRVPNTTLFALPGIKAETAIIAFDLNGIAVSSGSACSSGKVSASHVLAAMGADPALSRGAIRLSIGYSTTEADLERLLNAWKIVVSSLSKELAA
jgi:cysteine desulfurase